MNLVVRVQGDLVHVCLRLSTSSTVSLLFFLGDDDF